MTKPLYFPRYEVGEFVTNRAGWKRYITRVFTNYNRTKGYIGYSYLDAFGERGRCSEAHLVDWTKRGGTLEIMEDNVVLTRLDGDPHDLCRMCHQNPRNLTSGLCATCISDESVLSEDGAGDNIA